MSKAWQIYYNTIFGAFGGLVAWSVLGSIPTTQWNVHLANSFNGAGIGLFIGLFLGIVEGLFVKRSLRSVVFGAFWGGFVGVFAGMVGLFTGGVVFLIVKGGLIARMLGWLALGIFLGLGQGLISLKFQRTAYSLVGGALAGLVGGALYETFTQLYLQQSAEVQIILGAVGLILIGMSLGSIIPISVALIGRGLKQRGIVVILTGRRANMEIEIINSATLGSSDACDIFVPENGIEKKQAMISKGPQGFQIQNMSQSTSMTVNSSILAPHANAQLPDNAIIHVGQSQLRFKAS